MSGEVPLKLAQRHLVWDWELLPAQVRNRGHHLYDQSLFHTAIPSSKSGSRETTTYA